MHVAIYAYDALHDARYGAQIVRHHDDGHLLAQTLDHIVELMLETIVHEVGRLIENEQSGLGDDGPA